MEAYRHPWIPPDDPVSSPIPFFRALALLGLVIVIAAFGSWAKDGAPPPAERCEETVTVNRSYYRYGPYDYDVVSPHQVTVRHIVCRSER